MGCRGVWVVVVVYILEESIATCCTAVPGVHRVNRFRQLGTARLVDTARIDPHELIPVRESLSTAPPDFRGDTGEHVARMARVRFAVRLDCEFENVLIGLFPLFGPYVREDGVMDGTGIVDGNKFERLRVQ